MPEPMEGLKPGPIGPAGAAGANGADGADGADGAAGAAGADGGGSIEIYSSNVAMTAYGTSGVSYTPLAKNATEQYVQFMLTAWKTGSLEISLKYAMSASNAGDVALSVAHVEAGDGESPNGALTEEATFTITPGSNTTLHTVDSGDDATMAIAVTAGDVCVVKIRRKNVGGDTHTGDFNVVDIRVEIV